MLRGGVPIGWPLYNAQGWGSYVSGLCVMLRGGASHLMAIVQFSGVVFFSSRSRAIERCSGVGFLCFWPLYDAQGWGIPGFWP